MTKKKKVAAGLAVGVALLLGAGGIAWAVGGGDDEVLAGPDAERAAQAALEATGGGDVLGVEAADEGASGYEVEVKKADGSVTEVAVDPSFAAVATAQGEADQGEAGDD